MSTAVYIPKPQTSAIMEETAALLGQTRENVFDTLQSLRPMAPAHQLRIPPGLLRRWDKLEMQTRAGLYFWAVSIGKVEK